MSTAPESYLEAKRPPLREAIELEGDMSLREATESLVRKGYFTPPPRPWKLGVNDRGMGRYSYAVLDRFDDLVAENICMETAEFIVEAANAFDKKS